MVTRDTLAECMARTLGDAKSRLLRARGHLRDRLTKAGQVHFESDGSVCGHAGRQGEKS